MRALIVDDSRYARGYPRSLLESKGMECSEAADGRDGLECLKNEPASDVALLDLNKPFNELALTGKLALLGMEIR